MIGFDLSTVTDIRYGSSTVNSVWFRGTKIWPQTTPVVDWEREYLQVEASNPVILYTTIPAGSLISRQAYIPQYSLDKTTWYSWNENVSISLAPGDKIYFKGTWNSSHTQGDLNEYPLFQIYIDYNNLQPVTRSIKIQGNVMSLIFGDNFYGNSSSLVGYDAAFSNLFEYLGGNNTNVQILNIIYAHDLKLPATTLSENCYNGMFGLCRLWTAPELPATTLAYGCYMGMFTSNSNFGWSNNLTVAPALPATTLAEACYMQMFQGCPVLTTAPDLIATTLRTQCYSYMFDECPNLNYIKCLATDISAYNCTYEWVYGVSANGTFVKDQYMLDWTTGDDGIPYEWTVENQEHDNPGPGPDPINWAEEYMQVIAADPLTITTDIGTTYTYQFIIPQYSLDGVTWNSWNNSVSLNLNAEDVVYFKGTYNAGTYSQYNSKPLFKTTTANAHYDIAGNAMSLLYGDNFIGQTSIASYSTCFRRLFYNCSNMVDASRLILPATTLSNLCYHSMFEACSSLEVAPELPALTCSNECYHDMFHSCALVEPPELPATTLAQYCYAGMFNGNPITSITLSATTLTTRCYEWMFYNCSHLNEIICLATTNINTTNLYNWTSGVAATGTFIKDANASYSTGTAGIPSGWTVQDYSS